MYVNMNQLIFYKLSRNLPLLWPLFSSRYIPLSQITFQQNTYLFKVKNSNTRKKMWNMFKLTINTPEQRHWRRSSFFIVNFKQISHLFSSVSIINFEQVNVCWDYVIWGFI